MPDTTDRTTAIYDAIAAFQRTHRLPGLQHAQIRGLLAEHLARALPAAPAVQPPAVDRADRCPHGCGTSTCPCLACEADQTERRDRYTAAIREADGWVLDDGQHMLDAVMAVADAEQAELRKAVSELAQALRLTREYVGEELLPPVEGWSWYDALRRHAPHELPDEAQQPEAEAHPAEHKWAAELHDPAADEWVPGTRYIDRTRAVNALAHARRIGPTWKDGTPTQRRLVRATTTYTVEPNDEAQQGEEPTS